MSDRDSTREAIAALRSAYVAAGSPRGAACHSEQCLALATRRVFWPATAPGEDDPLYCDACAAWAARILETMGHKFREEKLPANPAGQITRLIELEAS